MWFQGQGLPHQLEPRALAHVGDGVFELMVREWAAVQQSGRLRAQDLHQFTTQRVSGAFQAKLLRALDPELTEAEQEWVRRGRNAPVTTSRRNQHAIHRQATGFEVLMGWLYFTDPTRLKAVWQVMEPWIESGECPELEAPPEEETPSPSPTEP